MAWRTIFITQPARLSISLESLKIKQEDENLIPLDDIVAVIVENHRVVITAPVLSKLAEYNISFFSCDRKGMPNGIFISFQKHSRLSKSIKDQINWKEPFKKRLQQRIIKNKIINQAMALKTVNNNMGNKIEELIIKVNSGDNKNIEAQAAQLYFKNLFCGLKRKDDNLQNAALNYGYAIIRGLCARTLVGAGFLPSLGLFHHSELNQFNLADDIMEPFRPFVDKLVYQKLGALVKKEKLNKQLKKSLVEILYHTCLINNEKQSLISGMELVIKSLTSATKYQDYKLYKEIYFP